WEALRKILDEHKRRVIDPTVGVFRGCLGEQTRTAPEDTFTAERMRDVVSYFDAINRFIY
ncbi:MAG: hypothetical protein P8Z30_17965, partial [Acidobacteriota bacterium]